MTQLPGVEVEGEVELVLGMAVSALLEGGAFIPALFLYRPGRDPQVFELNGAPDEELSLIRRRIGRGEIALSIMVCEAEVAVDNETRPAIAIQVSSIGQHKMWLQPYRQTGADYQLDRVIEMPGQEDVLLGAAWGQHEASMVICH